MDVSLAWAIEELMLEEYFLLVRRIPGISLSIEEYWELDTWTTAKLLALEKEIIKQEQESLDEQENKYVEQHEDNSEAMNEIMDSLSYEG